MWNHDNRNALSTTGRPLQAPVRARRGASGAALGHGGDHAGGRGRGTRRTTGGAEGGPPRPADGARDRRPVGRRRSGGRAEGLAAGQPARDAPPVDQGGGAARGPGGRLVEGLLGVRDGVADGPARGRLRGRQTVPRRSPETGPRMRQGEGGKTGAFALRRPARRLRARRPGPRHRHRVRRARGFPARPALRRPRRPGGAARRTGPRRPVPGRQAKGARRPVDGGAGLRFRPRAARYQPASLLRRHARRRPHHDALRRGRFHLQPDGGAARNRPCPLRAGLAETVARTAGRRGAGHEHPRKPVAADRDAGMPVPGFPRLRGTVDGRSLRGGWPGLDAGKPVPPLHPRRTRLHPRRRRRGRLSAACNSTLSAGEGDDRRRYGNRRSAGRLERRLP